LKYKVITPFNDKDTHDRYGVGSSYETSDENRAIYLQEQGYLGDVLETSESSTEETNEDIKSLGSGWYELPNGEKVQGKEKADEALKELQGSDE
jgi:hypothetical protein